VAAWQAAGTPGEDRTEAARRISYCFDEWDDRLDLRHLGLTDLPACLGELAHLDQLDVSHNALSRLPQAIEELESLRVLNLSFNRFTQIPNILLELSSECSVWMAGNQVSELECLAFMSASEYRGGPLVSVEQAMLPQDQWEEPELGQEAPLPQALATWAAELGGQANPLTWHDSDHPHAGHFGGWLIRLRNTPDFSHPQRREDIIQRVRTLLSAMQEDAAFRDTCFHLAHESVGTCEDNVALGLNRLEMAYHNRRAERGELSPAALFELGQGMFRLERLTAIAEEKFRALQSTTSAPDQVDVHLAYQAGLRETLNLPVSISELRFGNLSGVGVEDLKRAAETILRLEEPPAQVCLRRYLSTLHIITRPHSSVLVAEPRRHPLARFLAESWQPWQAHAARHHADEADRHAERMFALLERLERQKEAGEINEGEYLAGMNAAKFYANHGLAYEMALRMMVEGHAG
jgi:Leucine-rich repeat (LRR) protein